MFGAWRSLRGWPLTYRQALALLERRGNEVQGINLGLHRIDAVMRAVGNPHRRYPSLHIAGTNGKGSVAAMAESILRCAGFTTGLYTSPHLVRIEERISVDGRPVSPRAFASAAEIIDQEERALLRAGRLDRALTFFEFVTACAFLNFACRRVDIAVLEVGLGGRLDATNIISPRVCVITGISYDHQNILGSTLEQIAQEKAGIIKPGVPVISGCRGTAVRRVIGKTARERHAPLIEIDRHCRIIPKGQRGGRYTFDLEIASRRHRNLRLALAGSHQVRNAALSIAAVESCVSGPLPEHIVRRGLRQTEWPGRLDEYRAPRRTLLDGAHNPEGAQVLRDFLRAHHREPIHLVFGALRDKDIRGIGARLFPLADVIHLAPLGNGRAATPDLIAAIHPRHRPRMHTHDDSRAALRHAWESCPRSGLVVVAGSLYLIGEVLPLVRKSIRG